MNDQGMKQSNLVLFDTHCHFDFAPFSENYAQHLQHCRDAGVAFVLIPTIGTKNWSSAATLASEFPTQVYFSLGFHPYFLTQLPTQQEWHRFELALQSRDPRCVAVGECGLDWHIDVDTQIQRQVMQRQIDLASHFQLPLILHCRKSHSDLMHLLKKSKFQYGGIIHGFSGSVQQALAWIALGFKIGVGGVITYPRASKTRRTIQELPIEALVLETDAPDMPLHGYQGQPNHPQRLPLILKALAALRAVNEQELAPQLLQNSLEALRLDKQRRAQ
jgi:TatD DNase family protein